MIVGVGQHKPRSKRVVVWSRDFEVERLSGCVQLAFE